MDLREESFYRAVDDYRDEAAMNAAEKRRRKKLVKKR
jgi:hypothetical protein